MEPSETKTGDEGNPELVKNEKKAISKSWKNKWLLDVWAYLAGCDLFHKIAVTSKLAREKILKAGLLDQDKVVTLKRRVSSSENCI
jgi:hypothetical protein